MDLIAKALDFSSNLGNLPEAATSFGNKFFVFMLDRIKNVSMTSSDGIGIACLGSREPPSG